MSCGTGNKISRGSHAVLSNLSVEQNPRQASERKGRKKNPATNCKTEHRFQGLQGRVGKGLGEGWSCWGGTTGMGLRGPCRVTRQGSWGLPEDGVGGLNRSWAGPFGVSWALPTAHHLKSLDFRNHRSFLLPQAGLTPHLGKTLGLQVLKISRFLQSFLPLIPGSHMKLNSNSPCCTLSTVLVLYPPGRTPTEEAVRVGVGCSYLLCWRFIECYLTPLLSPLAGRPWPGHLTSLGCSYLFSKMGKQRAYDI